MNRKKVVLGLGFSFVILSISGQSTFAASNQKQITVTTIASGLSTFLLGSTAQETIARSPIPVVVARL